MARSGAFFTPKFLPPSRPPPLLQSCEKLGWHAVAYSRDGKHLAAVCRIKALWCLHCCPLAVCGFGEGDRQAKSC